MKLVRFTGIVALVLGMLLPVASASAAGAIYVRHGESIQAAIDAAPSGSLISVERGTYLGNLDIHRPVRLIGHGAVITPALKPTQNVCLTPGFFDGLVGVCVHGVINADGSIKSTISRVSVEGFAIRDFSGPGIAVIGVDRFSAVRNVTAHNGMWGMFINSVSNLSLLYNTSYANGTKGGGGSVGDGINVADSPSANAVIVGNTAYDNAGAGIVLIDTKGGRMVLNSVHGNCAGIVVAATGAPGQSGSGSLAIQLNHVRANNRLCPAVASQGVPALGGIGIALMGAQDTVVALNDVRDNLMQTGSGIPGGGIVLVDAVMFGAGAPTDNSVRLNWLSGNTPNDIFGDGTGTGNTVSGNTCAKTNLAGAC